MSERARRVVASIRHLEYVAAWADIPFVDRPGYRVVQVDGEWRAVPLGVVSPVEDPLYSIAPLRDLRGPSQ